MKMIQLKRIDDPIRLTDYLKEYECHIQYILENMTFVNLTDQATQKLLKMEIIRAETIWYTYYETNFRAPDYHFLQNEIIDFGIFRLPFFEQTTQEEEGDWISADNFVHRYIVRLREEKWLSSLFFAPEDLTFIERYTKKKAKDYFQERDQYVPGYESFRISKNSTMQRLGYEQLKKNFWSDPLICKYAKGGMKPM
ncbi:hypothetical protein QFV16_002445 [Enterococcus faecium]|nr:hypothetical protein [Enterococcus faecium]